MPDKPLITDELVNLARGLTRPCLTLFLTVHWAMLYWAVMQNGGSIGDIDAAYTAFVWGLDLWWFGDRTLLKGKSIVALIKGGA